MKKLIAILFFGLFCINPKAQTTETRYYNGKQTQETALKKLNEYIKLTQSDKRLKFVGGSIATYQIDGIWEQKINETDI